MNAVWAAALFTALAANSGWAQVGPAAGGGVFAPIPTVKGPAPHLPDGTPDLSGAWMGGGANAGDISKALKPGVAGNEVKMLPWAQEVYDHRMAKDDPEAACLPFGIPRSAPYPWRLVQARTHYFVLYEGNIHSYRQIFIDGRPHPKADDLDPTWYGHSIGHWEGETLVVHTVGFNDKFWFDALGHPHTEKLHTVERITRSDLGTLQMEVLIDDAGAYEKPFTTVGRARLMPGDELMEYICQENDQDAGHYIGPARLPTEGITEPLRKPDR